MTSSGRSSGRTAGRRSFSPPWTAAWCCSSLDAEPFLVVGLIAGIRKVLIVTAEAEKSFRWNVEGIELLILAGLILVMATAVCVWRRSTRPGDCFPLQEARRSRSPEPSPTPVRGS
ncbi:phosphate-starvation-inducible PsiE family protein [Streptomyces umbrinus]|uniref:phosphate-starvation-inducible PsiE family protein n=1 Tax=Streptomyces umbrinus TaxID=67370 RepID=UPI003C2DF7D2